MTLVLGPSFLVLGPSLVLGPWCDVALSRRTADRRNGTRDSRRTQDLGRTEDPERTKDLGRTRDLGRTKHQAPGTKD